jgi:hypothetical protein
MLIQILQICVSIVRCNIICNFLSRPPIPPAGAVGEIQRTVGAVLIALAIPKQAILYSLLNYAWLVLNLILGHHIVAA